jgi:hypothetical protein
MSSDSDNMSPVPGAGEVDPDIVAPTPSPAVPADDMDEPDEQDGLDAGDDDARRESCPVTVLGSYLGVCYFLTPRGELEAIPAKSLNTAAIRGLFRGCEWWLYREFPKTKTSKDSQGNEVTTTVGWRWEPVTWWLFRETERLAMFDPGDDVLRGCGVWRDDAGELVVHCGDRVWHRGEPRASGIRIGDHVYLGQPPRPEPDFVRPAAAEEALAFDSFIRERWGWKSDYHARLFTGWCVCAWLSGALAWRPHIHVGGAYGGGKTTLMQAACALIGSKGLLSGSDPTGPAIARMTGLTSGAFLLDEVEPDENNNRWNSVVETVRLASSDKQAPRVRAGMGGPWDVATYRLRSCFILAGTNRPEPLPQDMSRIAFLHLKGVPAATFPTSIEEALAQWAKRGPALRARIANSWRRFREESARVIEYLASQNQTRRFAEQYGTLIAAREVFVCDSEIDLDSLEELVAELLMHFPDETRREHEQCMDHFLTKSLQHWRSGEQLSIVKLIGYALSRQGDYVYWDKLLRANGVRLEPMPTETRMPTSVWIATDHASIKDIFAGTRWKDQAWKQQFEAFPGVEKPGPKKFVGYTSRVVSVPLHHCWSDPDEER